MLLRPALEKICVTAIGVVHADREVGHQLVLESENELVGLRRLHVVIEPRQRRSAARVRRVEIVEALQTQQLIALNHLVAVLVEAEKNEIGVVLKQIGIEDRAAELVDIAVVAGAQERLLVAA